MSFNWTQWSLDVCINTLRKPVCNITQRYICKYWSPLLHSFLECGSLVHNFEMQGEMWRSVTQCLGVSSSVCECIRIEFSQTINILKGKTRLQLMQHVTIPKVWLGVCEYGRGMKESVTSLIQYQNINNVRHVKHGRLICDRYV